MFSHTTNRVDVELGAKLYGHLQRLPLSFTARRHHRRTPAGAGDGARLHHWDALTLCIDAVFTAVFFAVMYRYSPTLFWVVVATISAYGLLSYFVTPILRRRLDEKFQRGAENQAFLVESVAAAETVKAMAIEPQMQRRWEEQLAGYINASFRAQNIGNIANQVAGLVSKVSVVSILWFGAHLVIEGAPEGGRAAADEKLGLVYPSRIKLQRTSLRIDTRDML